MQKILVIVGPTASGKSALAVELAKKFNGEVISADSRQAYRGLTIGTGKITKREMQGVRHHLLDVANPKTTFTASDFVKLGRQAIDDIAGRGKLPIICGGTGFYIDALLGHLALPAVLPNVRLRKELASLPTEELYARLQKRDPRRAKEIDPHNPVRLIRAIEIAEVLGAVPPRTSEKLYDELWIGIKWPQEKLHQRIHMRLGERMKKGMVAEAKKLHDVGLSYKRMEELGLEYRSLAHFLQTKITKPQLLQEIEIGNRQYAQTQMHYWRRNKDIVWLPANKAATIVSRVTNFLKC